MDSFPSPPPSSHASARENYSIASLHFIIHFPFQVMNFKILKATEWEPSQKCSFNFQFGLRH